MREMKDSLIKWVGEIPHNWAVKPIRAEFEEITQKNIDGAVKTALKFTYGEIVKKDSFDADDDAYVANTILNYLVVTPGTIMLNGLNLNFDFVTQRIGLVKDHGVITSAYTAFRPLTRSVTSEFATYLFKSYDICKAFHNMGGGVRKILNFSELKRYYIVYPDVKEQHQIVEFLDAKCVEIDALVADIQSQIENLEQYKRSVITEAVTKGMNLDAEMKDSGVQWIGMMPAHWDCIRGKYILKYIQKPVREDDGVITCFRDGEVTLRSNRREDGFTMADKEIGYQGIDVGDLVVHGMDGFAGAIGISDSRGKASPVLNVLDTDQNKRYIMYFLRSMAYSDVFLALATGIRVRSCDLRWNKLAELFYPVPPVEEQDEIVAHIDAIIRKADAVIADKKAQLETIESYKKSLIYEYVTGKKTAPGTEDTVDSVVIDPHVVLAGIAINQLGENLKGKTELQKILYLFDAYLGINPNTQYYRFNHGPYDLDLDNYLNVLVEKGWFRKVSTGAVTYEKGYNYSDFCVKYQNAFAEYRDEMSKLISFVKTMRRSSQIERIATAFAVWNDLILDGNRNLKDEDIIQEIRTNWTPNKAHSPEDTWKGDLKKMKKQGIIPHGRGLHTLPMPHRGV